MEDCGSWGNVFPNTFLAFLIRLIGLCRTADHGPGSQVGHESTGSCLDGLLKGFVNIIPGESFSMRQGPCHMHAPSTRKIFPALPF